MVRTLQPRTGPRRPDSFGERVAPWLAMLLALAAGLTAVVRRRVAPALSRTTRHAAAVTARHSRAADRAALRGLDRAAGWSWTAAVAMSLWVVRLARAVPPLSVVLVRRFGRPVAKAAACLLLFVAVVAYGSGPTLQLASTLVGADVDSPDALPPLEQRSVIEAADGTRLATVHREINRRLIPLQRLPDHVVAAVISAEDRRFRRHDGYDVEAIGRAALANFEARAVTQGGSTITQQVAKGIFTQGDRTLARKWVELVHAVALDRSLSKDEILERYLNQVYFGSGAYGIAAAAEEYFAVPAGRLTVRQAALLAGLIRSPSALNPRTAPQAAMRRRNAVLRAMGEEGYLTPDEVRRHSAAGLRLAKRGAVRTRATTEPHEVAAVKRELLAIPALGATRRERARLLNTGGIRVVTSIRPRLQKAAAHAVAAHTAGIGPHGALAAVDPRTGRVVALHGGSDFGVAQFDLATQGRRQPGSAFKPFVAAAGLAAGLDPDEPLHGDSPVEIDLPDGGAPWRVHNYESGDHGPVTLEQAMAASVNTAFAQIVATVGVDDVARVAGDAGIDVRRALGPRRTRGPAVALGGITHGVTPLEMASAYGVFATGGKHATAHLVTEVRGPDGTTLYSAPETAERVLDEAVAGRVRAMLRTVVRDGTGTQARVARWDVIGKTGTTQNHADAWFVGTTATLSTAVWVGHADAQRPVPGLTGGTVPARLWRSFNQAVLDASAPVAFPRVARDLPAPTLRVDRVSPAHP